MSPESQHILDTLHEGEPIFILRGNDALALMTISYWYDNAAHTHVNAEKLRSASRHHAAFQDWANTHGVKVPD